MGHPIFKEAPSTDMTKPQERQAELDAKIAEYLAKGGEIHAFDNFRRPVESGPWRSKSIHPEQQKPAQAAPVKAKPAKPAAPVKAKPVAGQPAQPVVVATIDVSAELRALRKQSAAIKRRLNRLSCSAGGRA
ncbi:TPA: hypothetical protein ACUL4Z_000796 [Pseudomonas aeruginosa]|uniref:hypothetical protein n=1 Tax=Pseudomonadaceae TaxID=135621 RepID=UPI000AD04ECE|nr:hypothetical protein [Pseudomonas aeruginosa]ELJ2355639.1 hypothetical protein [Pseudomonas aeruginosa]HBO5745771.1 hypothetical protein [Pseudomonas aeruginosa]HBO5782086.1 hypothetical protein [Pseudomonas aeruginosa]HBO6016774.1 hypothetical protein [Pseudomonas aeruginosa]HBO6023257.1 hypothetical protein [Pseudomonas aeruginosa]